MAIDQNMTPPPSSENISQDRDLRKVASGLCVADLLPCQKRKGRDTCVMRDLVQQRAVLAHALSRGQTTPLLLVSVRSG